MSAPVLRTATLAEVGTMLDWAAEEGWNPGTGDAAAFHATDPEGFFVAEIAGRPVASISVVNQSADFAFLGFYICRPGYRGQGIGLRLWHHALLHAGGRTVGLDGVAAQEANYARSGFVRAGATVRMEGGLSPRPDARITRAGAADFESLQKLDTWANGCSRLKFIGAWLAPLPDRQSLVLRQGGGVTGFATLRRCRDGIKIGPVVAPDADAALALARAGLAVMPADRVILDVPSQNAALLKALRQLGFAETFATARMYRGTPPRPSSGLQAIATMELG